jgi:hypothetical protein
MWYLYTIELYLSTRRNEILSFVGKCMKLENIILSEVSHVQKAPKLHVFPHMWNKDLIQRQQSYEKQVTLKRGHYERWRVKEESLKSSHG